MIQMHNIRPTESVIKSCCRNEEQLNLLRGQQKNLKKRSQMPQQLFQGQIPILLANNTILPIVSSIPSILTSQPLNIPSLPVTNSQQSLFSSPSAAFEHPSVTQSTALQIPLSQSFPLTKNHTSFAFSQPPIRNINDQEQNTSVVGLPQLYNSIDNENNYSVTNVLPLPNAPTFASSPATTDSSSNQPQSHPISQTTTAQPGSGTDTSTPYSNSRSTSEEQLNQLNQYNERLKEKMKQSKSMIGQ